MHRAMMKSSTEMACCMLAVVVSTGIFGMLIPAASVAHDYATDSTATDAAGIACSPETASQPGTTDSLIATQIETAYRFNESLGTMPIQTKVTDGKVTSDLDRDLAVEIAKSMDGVTEVENFLAIHEGLQPIEADADIDVLQKVKDATTTAQVKSRLIGNSHIAARDIDVDTENSVVRLKGEVGSGSEKQLAEYIARNTSSVHTVFNELQIRHSG